MTDFYRKTILVLGDFSMLWASLFLALALRHRQWETELIFSHIPVFSFLFICWLIVFSILNLYDFRDLGNHTEFFMSLSRALFVSALISIAFFYLTPRLQVTPKTTLFLMLGLALLLLALWRRIFNSVMAGSLLRRRTLVIGWDHTAMQLASFFEPRPQLGYQIVGIMRLTQGGDALLPEKLVDREVTTELSDIGRYTQEEEIDFVVISPEAYRQPQLAELIYQHLPQGLECINASTLYEHIFKGVPLTLINHVWFLERVGEGKRRAHKFVKRVVDVALAVIIGAIFFIPGLIIAFAIKWDTRGPVFYRQLRLGMNGKPFWLLKFRSMIANDRFGGAEGLTGAQFSGARDPRITRVGQFIRRRHLDEFAQLWNILKGEMSFVGPRPERPEFYEKWKSVIPFFSQRQIVKPGLTGWAQLHYNYGDTPEAATKNLQYDLYHIKHRTILLDIAIILKTIRSFFRGAGR